MNDLFIPYELAVLAKQKGFNEPCLAKYTKGELFWHPVSGGTIQNSFLERSVTAPLYKQLEEWLKEKHNTHIEPITSIDENGVTSTKYRVLIVYAPNVIRFPKSKYSIRDFMVEDINQAIEQALIFIK